MNTDQIRITGPVLKVLAELLSNSGEVLSGSQIAKSTKIASGTLYPILFRLEAARWVESKWEEVDPSEAGRPRRRLYSLTGVGELRAKAEFRTLATLSEVWA